VAAGTLTTRQKHVVSSASRIAMVESASRLASYAGHGRWLGIRNAYASNTLATVKRDSASGSMNSKHMSELLAASAPSHCIDGWSFVGRALACHFNGDAGTARHLAYYAELRAGAALLATAGIGVLNYRHFVIDSSGKALPLKAYGTHTMMWLALEQWARSTDAADVLGSAFTPASIPMDMWVGNLPGGSSWQPIGEDWLLAMGLDLKHLAQDREARNEASYRPTHVPRSPSNLDASTAARFAMDLWGVVEPTSYRAFDHLDMHLLRRTMEVAFLSVRGRSSRQSPRRFERDIRTVVASSLGSGSPGDSVRRFLLRELEPDDASLLSTARIQSAHTDARHHLSVIARAVLLLRVATGATTAMLSDAGVPFAATEFWWGGIGETRGLWERTPNPLALPDLWADVSDALDDLEAWLSSPQNSYMSLRADCAPSIAVLSNAEVIGLWGLAS